MIRQTKTYQRLPRKRLGIFLHVCVLVVVMTQCLCLPSSSLAVQENADSPAEKKKSQQESLVEQLSVRWVSDVSDVGQDGQPNFLSHYYGPGRIGTDGLKPLVESVQRGGSKKFIQYLDHPIDKDAVLVAAYLGAEGKNGLGFYAFKDGKLRFETHIGERMRHVTFHQSKSGDVFLGSRTGVIYWRKANGEFLRYQVPYQEGQEPNYAKMFRAIQFTESKEGVVCAYSIANRKYHQRALFDIAVADPKTQSWRTVKLETKVTGPAVMTGQSTLSMLLYDRFINIDIVSGESKEVQFPVPREGESRVTPVSLHRMSDGTVLSCWRKMYRSFKPYDVDPFADGFYQRVCQWQPADKDSAMDAGSWTVVAGKDRMITKKVLEATDEHGGWWIAGGEDSMLHRRPDGSFRYFDFRDGMTASPIERMRFIEDDLWVIQSRSVNKIDWKKFAASKAPPAGQWREIITKFSSPLSYNAPISIPIPIITNDDCVVCISTPQIDYPLPDVSVFSTKDDWYIFEDKKQKPWLLGFNDQSWYIVGWFDGVWKRTEIEKQGDRDRYEVAADWLRENGVMGESGRIGQRIVFGPEGKIIVRVGEQGDTIRLFDGQVWGLGFSKTQLPNDVEKIAAIAFDDDSVQVWFSRSKASCLPFYQWQTNNDKVPVWSPYTNPIMERTDWRASRKWVSAMGKQSPLKGQSGEWNTSNLFAYVSFTPKQMAIGDAEGWTTVDVHNSPLSLSQWITRFGRHNSGNLVFASNVNGINRYFIYDAQVPKVTIAEKDLGEIAGVDAALLPKWNCEKELPRLTVRFRVDEGLWSEWQAVDKPVKPGMVPTKGTHELQLQIRSARAFLSNDTLKYSFSVAYDQKDMVDKLIEQLSAMDFKSRQQAEKDLVKLGPNILNYLRKRFESSKQPETRLGLKKVIESYDKK